MKITNLAIIQSITASICALSMHGQGVFQNLDFEAATVSEAQAVSFVPTSDALPGWTVSYGTNGIQTFVLFDGLIVGAPQVDLLGTNRDDITRIEGNFGIYLQGGNIIRAGVGNISASDATISQTGLVPATAQCILFKAQPGTDSLTLTLDGQNVPFVALETMPNYTLYGGDVSAFADQISELAFTTGSSGTGWNLDSIEFSPQAVPEPSTWAFLVAGSGLFFFRRQPR